MMHGPTVLDPDDRRRHKTYLIALLDDATRMIPYAAFTRSETVTAFLPVFERRSCAARMHGVRVDRFVFTNSCSLFRSARPH